MEKSHTPPPSHHLGGHWPNPTRSQKARLPVSAIHTGQLSWTQSRGETSAEKTWRDKQRINIRPPPFPTAFTIHLNLLK